VGSPNFTEVELINDWGGLEASDEPSDEPETADGGRRKQPRGQTEQASDMTGCRSEFAQPSWRNQRLSAA